MSATAEGIPDGTTVTAADATTVTLSQALTAAIASGTIIVFTAPTLGAVLAQRRGPVGELAASPANLETSLPLIDIVNECLEYLASAETPASGTVYDTVPGPAADAGEDEDGTERLLAAQPGYSTPATPGTANAAVEPAAFNKLKADFSACELPYSQALDVSRTYLRHLGGDRFEEMRTFRKCITEFVLDPANEPAGFQSWLWRYPVRVDTAIEYLGISPEEYTTLFQGAAAPPCAPAEAPGGIDAAPRAAAAQEPGEREGPVWLPAFLAETCLSYCEFYELWESGFVPFRNGASPKQGEFPRCEPCCPDDIWLQFTGDQPEQDFAALLVFIRLWRKLRQSLRRVHVRAAAGHLRRAAAAGRRRAQPGLHPPARRLPDAARRLRDGPRRIRRPRPARSGRRRPHAPAGAVGRPGRGPVAVGGAAADHAG